MVNMRLLLQTVIILHGTIELATDCAGAYHVLLFLDKNTSFDVSQLVSSEGQSPACSQFYQAMKPEMQAGHQTIKPEVISPASMSSALSDDKQLSAADLNANIALWSASKQTIRLTGVQKPTTFHIRLKPSTASANNGNIPILQQQF